MWDKFNALFDWGNCDYFDNRKCVDFKKWLINRLKSPANFLVKLVYETMLEYANIAIEKHTGIYFDF